MADRRHFVVGTAGHVDHGKTSLVKALTGVDCDRLPEEQARGITIELGFARWDLGAGLSASVIDVPGHERFVRTMTAGAAGIDAVLLVVAADDGVMPQTREHLAVCALLGVRAGVVAVTKTDLVDSEMLDLVRADVDELLSGTFLAGAEVVACSAKSALGLRELAEAMVRALPRVAQIAVDGPAFLAVDRVFSKPGAGAIVTGTLVRGTLRVGDEIDALPTKSGDAARLKIRGLHVHDAAVTAVAAASRVAVNLRGDDLGALTRGGALGSPGWLLPTRVVCAEIELLPSAAKLPKRAELVLHAGTSHRTIVLTLLGQAELLPGDRAFVRLAAEDPFPAYAGQRIVLRRPDLDLQRTIAGGHIVDPHPAFSRGDRPFTPEKPADRARTLVVESRSKGISRDELARRMPPETDPRGLLDGLLGVGAVVLFDGRCFDAALLVEAKSVVAENLKAFHARHPLLAGASPSELETQSPMRVRSLARLAVDALVAEGRAVHDGGLVRLREHKGGPGTSAVRADLAARFARAGLAPPLDEEVRAAAGLTPPLFRDALAELKREGTLRQLTGGLHYDVASLHALGEKVARWFEANKQLTPTDLKALSGGLTRKHAIPLLEWLDAEGMTRRTGDARVAGPRALGFPRRSETVG